MRRLLVIIAGCLVLAPAVATGWPDAKTDGPVIGIDLGTTYSSVGIYKNGRVEIIPNSHGNRITPSYVAFAEDEWMVGETAESQATRHSARLTSSAAFSTNPGVLCLVVLARSLQMCSGRCSAGTGCGAAAVDASEALFAVKRLMGRRTQEPEVQEEARLLPYSVADERGRAAVKLKVRGEEKTFSPEEVSATILRHLKETAEDYLGERVEHVVISVPAYFNHQQRQATKDAGAIAGLNVVRLINEPTAAAIAYALQSNATEKTVLVYDLGGGTFDVSVLMLEHGMVEVLATAGDTRLGGEDVDRRVVRHLADVFHKRHHKDLFIDRRAMQKLRQAAEWAKRALSTSQQAQVEIEALHDGINFSEVLTRAKFEDINNDLFEKTLLYVNQALKEADVPKDQVDEVVLVGGSTRIPKVQQLLRDFFDGKEPSLSVDPDEVVVCGAALQAAVISGQIDKQDLIVLDMTPHSIGLETRGGVMTNIINRSTIIPTRKSLVARMGADNQTSATFRLYQGERAMTKDNHLLGEFELGNIAPALRRVRKIELTFEVDADGILIVTADAMAQQNRERVSIRSDTGRLTEDQIHRMRMEAEENARADRQRRVRSDARKAFEA